MLVNSPRTLESPEAAQLNVFWFVSRVVRLWDVEKGVTVLKLSLNDYVRCLCVLSNGDVAAGCEDSTIALFSEKDFALKKPLKAHTMS